MNEKITKYKKVFIIILIIILLIFIFIDNPLSKRFGNSAEDTAVKFVEYMLDGDAKKCTSMMCDDLIAVAGYDTEKLFENAFDKTLDSMIEKYKDKYGKRWSYEVIVIDSFNVDVFDAIDYSPEYYEEGTIIKVVLEINHKGRGLFKEKDGTDEIELIMIYDDGKWLVYDMIL